MKPQTTNPRSTAAQALVQIIDNGHTLDSTLDRIEMSAHKALIQEMLYGVLRWFQRLDALAKNLLKQDLKPKDRDIHMLLLVGLYELLYMNNQDYAVVSETVSATKGLGKPWAKALLNACLRRAQREHDALQQRLDDTLSSYFSHPSWLIDLLREQYPQHWQQILQANNTRPPMHLRVNLSTIDRQTYLHQLEDKGFAARALDATAAGVCLDNPANVSQLPGFDHGQVSVQDGAAQLAIDLLDIQAGHRVLDACAAPGGKAAHILEAHPDVAALVLVEKSAHRSKRINENFTRLGLHADIKIADAAQPETWWDGQPFQRILLDAPCSATGVIRRHPDIKLHRQQQQIALATKLQARLFEVMWSLLDSGGKLLYATCSMLAAENQERVADFLEHHSDAREVELDLGWAQRRSPGYQILPGTKGMDGFYYACLQKK